MPEFQSSVKRAVLWFKTLQTDDKQDTARMMAAWLDSITRNSEPVIWAWCVEVLKKHGLMSAPLAQDIVITLYAIADAYSRRISGNKARE